MPELPEVENATRRLRTAVEGRTIAAVRTLHPSLKRQLSPAKARRLRQRRIERVERRGKHQLLHLDDGSVLHAHFRMTGDWIVSRTDTPPGKFTRAVIDLTDGTRVELHDSRALSALTFYATADGALPSLGIEADDDALDAAYLSAALSRRHSSIKPALMDQKVIAGLGNIYAAEALWRARISPRATASSISKSRLRRLVEAIRAVLGDELRPPGRYTDKANRHRFAVYDREGKPCQVCSTPIKRVVQAGRSTYYCSKCQRS
jgi:formamidopyrimidine-DNA glycosylase